MKKIKNILILPYSHQLGSTHTLISIGKHLKSLGYNVIVAGEGRYINLAKQNGLKSVNLVEIPIDTYRKKTDSAELTYQTEEEIELFIESEIALYKKLSIDLVISTLRLTAPISTKLTNIPHISLTYAILSNHYALSIVIPETHSLYKFHGVPVLFGLLNKIANYIYFYVMKKFAKPYNNIAIKHGLQAKKNLLSYYEGDITWLYDIQEFAPVKSAPSSFRYLGTIFNKVVAEKPKWIDEVKELKKKTNTRVIYVSMGSSGTLYTTVIENVIEYCKKNDYLVVTNSLKQKGNTGDIEIEQYKGLYTVDYASAEDMLSVSDLVVSHGGRGTMYDSLEIGVPLVIIPHQSEQEWNTLRLEKMGAGKKVSKANYSKSELFYALDNIFDNYSTVMDNIALIKSYIKKYDWKIEVEKTIKDLDVE